MKYLAFATVLASSSCNENDNHMNADPFLLLQVKVAEGETCPAPDYYPIKITVDKITERYQVELSEYIYRQQS